MSEWYVTQGDLNLRAGPNGAVLAVLPKGHFLQAAGDAAGGWLPVSTVLSGTEVSGFVGNGYVAASSLPPPPEPSIIAECRTPPRPGVSRDAVSLRAYSLDEEGQPGRGEAKCPEDLTRIVEWLDVENSRRYLPEKKNGRIVRTFCNIYAHDYCRLAEVFLPRAWWKDESMVIQGPVTATYGNPGTIKELCANDLHDWLLKWGRSFGWKRLFDVDEMQRLVNGGMAGIISAHNGSDDPGHICAVVPETDGHDAEREDGTVTSPLQSQAGAENHAYWTHTWWHGGEYSSFSFWVHD